MGGGLPDTGELLGETVRKYGDLTKIIKNLLLQNTDSAEPVEYEESDPYAAITQADTLNAEPECIKYDTCAVFEGGNAMIS